jgi:general secretion pathway protein D
MRRPRAHPQSSTGAATGPSVRVCVLALLMAIAPARAADPAPGHPAPVNGTAAPRAGGDSVVLNFVNADLEAVVRAVGQFTGRTFVIDPRVKGTLTLVTERPVTREQAFEELLSALRLQGFTLVESSEPGGVARVLPEADAKLQGGRVVTPPTMAPRGDQVVTQVFRLQYESATNLVPVLRPLIAPNNTISAYPANNTLVITDYAENLRRLARIIEAVDSPATSEVEVVSLQYALATDVAAIVNKVLDEGARSSGQAVDAGQRVAVMAEPRTNSLILRAASRARLDQAKQLIAHFDQPNLTPGNINVVYLRNAQAVKLAPLLRAVLSSDPSFLQQASGSGLSVTPMTSSLGGQSGTGGTSQQGLSSQGTQQQGGASGAGYPSGGGGGSGSGGAVAGMIQADPATNALIISAPEPLYRNIRAIIDRLDVRPAQVMIESLVVELTGTQAAEFGIQWQALSGVNSSGTNVIGGTNFNTTNPSTNILSLASNIAAPAPGLNIGIVKGQITIPGTNLTITNIGLLARALETVTNTNILSRPNIQTLDNEEGKFLVGQNVGLLTGAYANTGTTSTSTVNPFQTFERHDVGLQLAIKPQISEGGTVRLAIYIEDSSIASGSASGNPILNKRSFQTNVIVEDGSFVVISGLIQDQADETQNKVPLLGNLPLIGRLFRYDTRDHTKTQTMVFLRPTIIRDESAAGEIAMNRYDYMRTQIAQTRQPSLPPLPNLSVEDLPAVPTPAHPKPAPARPVTPDQPPASESLPVAPQAPQSTTMPRSDAAGAAAATAALALSNLPPMAAAPANAPPAVVAAPTVVAAAPAVAAARASAAEQAPVAATPVLASSAKTSPYQLIQVSAVHDIGRGRQLQQRLTEAGFDSYWESVRTTEGDVVRIRISVERRAARIADAISMLRRLGYDPVLVAK